VKCGIVEMIGCFYDEASEVAQQRQLRHASSCQAFQQPGTAEQSSSNRQHQKMAGCTTACSKCYTQESINQLHVFLAREEPKKGATPKPPLVVPNR
jgi:hypothetical protein